MLLNGQGHHNFYYSAVDYMRLEQRTGWFTQNRRLLEMMGKATWQSRRSPCCDRPQRFVLPLRRPDPRLGRRLRPSSGRPLPNVYVTEAEIKAGLTSRYPVVFDTATGCWTTSSWPGSICHVRAGGTFVAVSDTGRHSLLEADAWPIRRLTGFKVLGRRENGRLTIVAGNPLLQAIERIVVRRRRDCLTVGRHCSGPEEPGTRQWDRVGTLGRRNRRRGDANARPRPDRDPGSSVFWRSESLRTATGTPLQESVRTTFFGDLFSALGIDRQADIDSEDVWVRRFVTKNGLQQWVMVYNSGRAPQKRLALSFPLQGQAIAAGSTWSRASRSSSPGKTACSAYRTWTSNTNVIRVLGSKRPRAWTRSNTGLRRSGVTSRAPAHQEIPSAAQLLRRRRWSWTRSVSGSPRRAWRGTFRGLRSPQRGRLGKRSATDSGTKWDTRLAESDTIGDRSACPSRGKGIACSWPLCPSTIPCSWNVPTCTSTAERPASIGATAGRTSTCSTSRPHTSRRERLGGPSGGQGGSRRLHWPARGLSPGATWNRPWS